jgi:outer membrane usher protein
MAGIVNTSANRSRWRGSSGWQYGFGYRYNRRAFSFGYQGTRRDARFVRLGEVESIPGSYGVRRSDVVTASLSAGSRGTLGAAYFETRAMDDSRVRLLSVSYSRALANPLSLHVSASRDLERGHGTALLQFVAAFGANGNLMLGKRLEQRSREFLTYRRGPPAHGGVGWHLGLTHAASDQEHHHASLAWSNAYNRMEAGVYGAAAETTNWASIGGSLIAMDSQVFASRRINDAFVLVATDGVAQVPVRYENQLVGRTNERGYLLVPWVNSHYAAKYEIDILDLPAQLRVPSVERRLSVKRHSGALLRFDIQPVIAVTVSLVDVDGTPLPPGSIATQTDSGQRVPVGFDGLAYFENPGALGELAVTLPHGTLCHTRFRLEPPGPPPMHIGPLTCR